MAIRTGNSGPVPVPAHGLLALASLDGAANLNEKLIQVRTYAPLLDPATGLVEESGHVIGAGGFNYIGFVNLSLAEISGKACMAWTDVNSGVLSFVQLAGD